MLSRIFSLDRKIKINKVQFRENCFIVLIIYEAINRIFSLWTNKIKFNIILFQDLKYPRRKILWIPRTVPKLLDIFLRRTINIRALFHHFRIIWNYSKKGKTATLLPWLHTIPCSSPYFSPLFFMATTEGGGKLSTPADSSFFPFSPFRPPLFILACRQIQLYERENPWKFHTSTCDERSKKQETEGKGRTKIRDGDREREREEINSSIDIYVKTHFVFVNGYNVLCLSFLKLFRPVYTSTSISGTVISERYGMLVKSM